MNDLPDVPINSTQARLVYDLAVTNLNFMVICDYFGIPPEKRYNPNCGMWIIKWIKEAEHVRFNKRPDELFDTSLTPKIEDITPASGK
jgi:hypothetical protein